MVAVTIKSGTTAAVDLCYQNFCQIGHIWANGACQSKRCYGDIIYRGFPLGTDLEVFGDGMIYHQTSWMEKARCSERARCLSVCEVASHIWTIPHCDKLYKLLQCIKVDVDITCCSDQGSSECKEDNHSLQLLPKPVNYIRFSTL